MKRMIFAMLILLFTATGAMAGQVEWNWNDETMGYSRFHKDFGNKRWTGVYYYFGGSQAGVFHLEQCWKFSIRLKNYGETFYRHRKGSWGAEGMFEELVDFEDYTGFLTVEGRIEVSRDCGINTGRVRLRVIGYFDD